MEVADEGKQVIVRVKEWRWWQLWDRSPSVVIVCWVVGNSSSGGRSGTAWRGTLCVEKAAYVHLDRRCEIMYQRTSRLRGGVDGFYLCVERD
jgi:hypothetical protein